MGNGKPCEKCGDKMNHDDDGPDICRFCSEYRPVVGNPIAETVAADAPKE